MDLWIRSQDKMVLTRNGGTRIVLEQEGASVVDETNDYILGMYNTEERALEILDEIQSILNLKDMYKYDRELVLKSWENVDEKKVKIVRQQMSVYEMPKE